MWSPHICLASRAYVMTFLYLTRFYTLCWWIVPTSTRALVPFPIITYLSLVMKPLLLIENQDISWSFSSSSIDVHPRAKLVVTKSRSLSPADVIQPILFNTKIGHPLSETRTHPLKKIDGSCLSSPHFSSTTFWNAFMSWLEKRLKNLWQLW